jgi:hypothetical protein
MKPDDYGRVDPGPHHKVVIVASGPSAASALSLIPLLEGVHIIAVNAAIRHAPVAHSWFTLDPGVDNRAIMAERRREVTHYAAVPDNFGDPKATKIAHRGELEPGIVWLRRLHGSLKLSGRPMLSEEPGIIHSGNSGWGALQIAYLMGARAIAIFGLDGKPGGYWYGGDGPNGPLDHLPALFASALAQLKARGVQVVNASPDSAITCFERMDPRHAVRWIDEVQI